MLLKYLSKFVFSMALLLAPAALYAADSRPPNIVFFLADDLGYGDIGPFGQSKIKTPNLDRMAAEGKRFTQHYAGNAVCAPSRCVLMTGLHPGHAYIRDNKKMPGATSTTIGKPEIEGQYPIPDSAVTLAETLKAAGYTTGGFGKWGLGGPAASAIRSGRDLIAGMATTVSQ